MSVLIDPPLWPAHGTFFSHLVSDVSLAELHAFARSAGLRPRAFDRDHYDVPQALRASLIQLGAEPVSAGELTRRLVAAGLRVPARERPDRHDAWLRRQFASLAPPSADAAAWAGLGEDLLGRWGEPSRHYHDKRHLNAVLRSIVWLNEQALTSPGPAPGMQASTQPPPRPVETTALLAAWWHDAVYRGCAGADEEDSADLALSQLTPVLGAPAASAVARAVLSTRDHVPGDDPAAQLLCDADLQVLARPAASYRRYVADVRRDYAAVSDEDFARGRSAVLDSLLALPRLYTLPAAHDAWEARARENLAAERAELTARGTA